MLTLVTTATSAATMLVESHVPPNPTSRAATATATSANHVSAAAVRISNQLTRSSPCSASTGSSGAIWARSASSSLSAVSYTHLRAHETDSYLVCRLLLEK